MKNNIKINLYIFVAILLMVRCNLKVVDDVIPPTLPKPVAQFTVDKTTCDAPCAIRCTNTSTDAAEYAWNFGDPAAGAANTSTLKEPPAYTYTKAGSYKITLIVAHVNRQRDTAERTINITVPNTPRPMACFTATNNNCTGPCDVAFNAGCSRNAASYAWDFGDGGSAVIEKPTKTYAAKGRYNVRLTVTGPGGSDDTTLVVTITGPKPTANFTFSNDQCVGPCTVTFTNTSQNATSYQWTFGNGATSTIASPTQTYNSAGTYTVKLKAFNPDGVDSTTKTVTILSSNFQKVLDVSATDALPVFAKVRTTTGDYHVAYSSALTSGYRSIIIDKSGNLTPTTKSYPELENMGDVKAISTNDGMVLYGNNSGSTLQFTKVLDLQGIGLNRSLHFASGATLSQAFGMIQNANGELVLVGAATSTGLVNIGLLTANASSGVPTTNLRYNPAGNNFIQGISSVQNTDGTYTVLATDWTFGGNPKEYLFTYSGSFSNQRTLSFDVSANAKLLRLGSRYFIVNLNITNSNIVEVNSSGTVVARRDFGHLLTDALVNTTTQEIVVCGYKNKAAYLGAFKTLTGAPVFEKTYANSIPAFPNVTETNAHSVVLTPTLGYLVLGYVRTTSVDFKPFLIKTDGLGNTN